MKITIIEYQLIQLISIDKLIQIVNYNKMTIFLHPNV